jgi:hypothetical protein
MKGIENVNQAIDRAIINSLASFVLAVCVSIAMLSGQIVIDWTEIPHENGLQWIKNTADSVIVDLGSSGGPQTWDFTSQPMGAENVNTRIVAVSSTPLADSFPGANLCYVSVCGSDTVYSYYDLSPSYVAGLGYGTTMSDSVIVIRFDPTDSLSLPFMHGTEQHYHYGWTVVINTSSWARYDCFGTVVCNGYGFVEVPYGQFECLRRCAFDTLSSTIYINGVPLIYDTTTTIKCGFEAEAYGSIVCVASFPDETDPYFTNARELERLTYFSSIEEHKNMTAYSLSHYPTPFSDDCVIGYSLTHAGTVNVDIFDSGGRLVRRLIDQPQSAGYHSVVWSGEDEAGMRLPAGVYFYHVNTGTSRSIGKMIMVQ